MRLRGSQAGFSLSGLCPSILQVTCAQSTCPLHRLFPLELREACSCPECTAAQTYESGDKSWRVPAAQRKENPGLSTGQRRDLKCGPVKLDVSLPCPKPQFLSLPPGSNADFEGAIASEIVTWEARVTSACRP